MDHNKEDINISKFNAGMYLMDRVHRLQDRINSANLNPLAFNPEYQAFNYEIILNSCNSLLSETWGKLTKEEKINAQAYKRAITKIVATNPPYETKRINGSPNKTVVNMKKWSILKELLVDYELFIKELMENHGINSPNIDWDTEGL